MGTTYDAGALLAAEANRRDLWAIHARSLQRGERPVVPAGVLSQAWRGGPQAQLSRLLRGCRIEDLDEHRARAAGFACARSGTRDIVDASVVAGALARGDLVITSDATSSGLPVRSVDRSASIASDAKTWQERPRGATVAALRHSDASRRPW